MKKYNVAILGATGAVGQEFLNLIEERNLPFADLKMLASKRSAGKIINFMGKDYTVEQGQAFARNCMLNILAVLQREIGDLNRVTNVVKMLAFVASDDEFYQQPQVANGASNLLGELFGQEVGIPARSAIGVNVLPGNLPVEIEAIFEFK